MTTVTYFQELHRSQLGFFNIFLDFQMVNQIGRALSSMDSEQDMKMNNMKSLC